MPDYSVFGGCLRSAISFPELPICEPCTPTWVLVRSDQLGLSAAGAAIGEDVVDGDIRVRLHRGADGLTLAYDDTGSFQVSRDGTTITWHPAEGAREDLARLDILGRVLATALHASGSLCLHGSAVSLHGAGLAFMAPKFHGKSTLAQALVAAGARLATDDALPVDLGPPVGMRPGVHRIRLWNDSAAEVAPHLLERETSVGGKHIVEQLPEDRLMLGTVPLRAIYLLAPVPESRQSLPVERRLLPPTEAALAVVRHATIGPLLGGMEAHTLLDRAVEVARAVPVYLLKTVRDFAQLPAVVHQLGVWHSPASASAAVPDGVQ